VSQRVEDTIEASTGLGAATFAALGRAVGTRPRQWLVAVTLLLGVLAAVGMIAAAQPADRRFVSLSNSVQSLMSVTLPFVGVLLARDARRSPGAVPLTPTLLAATLLAGIVGAFPALTRFSQDPVHRGLRAPVAAVVEFACPDLRHGHLRVLIPVQHIEDRAAFGRGQRRRRRRLRPVRTRHYRWLVAPVVGGAGPAGQPARPATPTSGTNSSNAAVSAGAAVVACRPRSRTVSPRARALIRK
jgi:hypothetical protein